MNASPSSRGRSIDSRFLRVTGAVVAIVGGVVFAGWALGIDWLIVLIPHSVPMKANTALGFVLSGCAIFLLPTRSERAKRAARVCATMVSGIALVTLVEYMSGWNLGIDEILFRATDPAVATSHPGRMSLNAVLGFALTAAALWLMSGPAGRARLPMILGWLGSLIAVIGLVAIFSYLVGFSFGYEWGKLAVMAIHTASLFVLIGAAVLCLAWREAGVVWMIGARLTMGIVGSLALIVVLAVYSNRSAKELVEAAARLRRTHESISKIHQLLSGLDEAQSAVRGFVITGNEDFLAPSGKAIPEAREYLRDLREDMLDNASQQARLAALEKLIAAYLEYSRETIDLRKTAGFDAAAQRIGTGRGNASMDEIRGRLREMEEEEERLLASRRALSIATTERTLAVLPFGVLLSVLVLALGVLRLNAEAAARQRAAEALWQSEHRLRLALEGAQIGDWELDLGTHQARRSPRHDQIFGYSEPLPEWSYEMFLKHVHEEDRARVDHAFQESLAAGRDWDFECRVIRHDGTEGWIWAWGASVMDGSGPTSAMLGMVRDITDRKRVEAALRASEERMRLAAEAAGIAVWEWDVKTDALTWDGQMFTIYGLPPTPEGRTSYQEWRARVLPADLAEVEARLRHTVATCGRGRREFRIARASDQAVRVIQAAEMVIAGSDGCAARMVGISLDITDRKGAEEEIGKLNADLERRAAELATVNEELEGFSYSVSHDLRAPLRAVDGFSRLVIQDYAAQLDDEGRRMLGVIRSETKRMGQLIDDLLAFSRLSRQKTEAVTIEMHGLAQAVFDELAALDPERKLRLDLHPLPSACGTPPMIRQVWANLISNAIKFTKERVVGEIEIGAREGGDGALIYYVKDNGAGFDMRHVGKLFGVFQRLHTEQEFEGTGVGLALVQRIVRRHGGQVWAEAEVNRGATFSFTLSNPKI